MAAGLTAAALSPAMALDPALGSMGFGTAPSKSKVHMPPVSTVFEAMPESLQTLLDAGYSIRTSSGDEGNILTLEKFVDRTSPSKWVRCELVGDRNGDVRLAFSQHVTSTCWKLN
nr:ABC transporter substrate-binding protein [Gluconobacter albidus]